MKRGSRIVFVARLLALLDETDGAGPPDVAVVDELFGESVGEVNVEVIIVDLGVDDEENGDETGLVKVVGMGSGGRDVESVPTVTVENSV